MTTWLLTESGENVLRRISHLGTQPYSDLDIEGIRSAVVSCATLVEAHVDKVLKELFSSNAAMNFHLTRALHDEVEDSIYRTWESRRKWLATAFDINITGDRPSQEFDAVVGLRNSIVHGDGRLTDLQISKAKDLFRLTDQFTRILGARVDGRKVILSPEVANRSAVLSKNYLLHFDGRLLGKFPNFVV